MSTGCSARRAESRVREAGHRLGESGRSAGAVGRLGARLEVLGGHVEPLLGGADVDADGQRAQVAVEHERLQEEDARERGALGAAREGDSTPRAPSRGSPRRGRRRGPARRGRRPPQAAPPWPESRNSPSFRRRSLPPLDERVRRLAPAVIAARVRQDVAAARNRRCELALGLEESVDDGPAVAKRAHAADCVPASRRHLRRGELRRQGAMDALQRRLDVRVEHAQLRVGRRSAEAAHCEPQQAGRARSWLGMARVGLDAAEMQRLSRAPRHEHAHASRAQPRSGRPAQCPCRAPRRQQRPRERCCVRRARLEQVRLRLPLGAVSEADLPSWRTQLPRRRGQAHLACLRRRPMQLHASPRQYPSARLSNVWQLPVWPTSCRRWQR